MSETGGLEHSATEVVDAEVRGFLEALREELARCSATGAPRGAGRVDGEVHAEARPHASGDGIDEAAQRVGTAAAAAGMSIGLLVTRLLHGARDQVEAGDPDPAARDLVEEAVAVAASAWERARELRRDSWLSFLTHEMKNPLNTVLNALWLLREHPDAPNATRFLDLADRGVRRIEATLKELRDLHDKAAASPAPRVGSVLPSQTHH